MLDQKASQAERMLVTDCPRERGGDHHIYLGCHKHHIGPQNISAIRILYNKYSYSTKCQIQTSNHRQTFGHCNKISPNPSVANMKIWSLNLNHSNLQSYLQFTVALSDSVTELNIWQRRPLTLSNIPQPYFDIWSPVLMRLLISQGVYRILISKS